MPCTDLGEEHSRQKEKQEKGFPAELGLVHSGGSEGTTMSRVGKQEQATKSFMNQGKCVPLIQSTMGGFKCFAKQPTKDVYI